MTKNKLIVLGIGLILIIILSALLIVLQPETDQNTQQTNSEPETANEENSSANENTADTSDNFNMPDEDGVVGEDSGVNENDEPDDEQLKEYADRALDNVDLPEDTDSISEELLRAHAELYSIYTQMAELESDDIDGSQESAERIMRERYSWYEFSSEEYGFTYNEDDFLTVAETEGYIEDASKRAAVLFEVLANENDDYYTGQLVYQYLQPYIWHEIADEAIAYYDPASENEQEREEAAERMFAQDVLEYIGDEYPEYLEGESSQ
ncbi:hypothetical protein [Salisediminibacterium halotolerans]|uniref:hypothetical protein n=1 Tax=Salisediminibacterium halotolerans TaxID=517425 RepID=UPI000EB05D78|nr:hypothetical protein [Salisediminibacterium halotolerans]RLJ80884.1 hypothetical protein BCL39_0188 [Actinophytocola xinjiangensis]RPE83930.1 hypothetical protein EDD67_2491 [Salisediminibacterium halotolerans]TWG37828.1 hypothetical protein BCL52_0188 [Salisediminibacterium halotolerans]GEL08467.1 hypothetical protein SHA02_18830 [Salisediminibacterium halotolerans]